MNGWIRRNIFNVLDVLKFIGIVAMILMFIHFNAIVADNARSAEAEATSTNQIVRSQGEILDAIKQLAIDNRVNSDQKTNIIICMLQVPVSQRTTDVLENCRSHQDNPVPVPTTTTVTPAPTPAPAPTAHSAKVAPKPPHQPNAIQHTFNILSGFFNRLGL